MPTYQNTKEILGSDEAAFNALVAHQLVEFSDDSITEIGMHAFRGQTTLQSVYLPNCKLIRQYAFYDCISLQRIFVGLYNNFIGYYRSDAFNNCNRLIIYVPDNLVSEYRNSSSHRYLADIIYGVSSADTKENEWLETEITDTPEQISSYVSNGTAASRYRVGQYKTIDLGSEGQIRMQIVDKNVRELANSTETAQLEWVAMDLLNTYHRMNPAIEGNTNNYVIGTGAIGSITAEYNEMQFYLDNTIWQLIPSVWQNMIKETKQITSIYNTLSQRIPNDVSVSKLRIPSYREMFSTENLETQGPAYKYAFFTYKDLKKKRTSDSKYQNWWLRSAYGINQYRFISYDGSSYGAVASSDNGILLSFST